MHWVGAGFCSGTTGGPIYTVGRKEILMKASKEMGLQRLHRRNTFRNIKLGKSRRGWGKTELVWSSPGLDVNCSTIEGELGKSSLQFGKLDKTKLGSKC